MKKGWKRKRLGEVCEFRGGGTPSKAVARFWTGDIPWVSPKDMKSTVVSDSIDHITLEAIEGSATSLIPENAVLIVVRSGILARTVPVAVTGRPLAINQDLKALCPQASLDVRFLYHLLESKMDVLLAMVSRGATVHRLQTDQIRLLDFGLPPLYEQQRIVRVLDEAFTGLATAQANAAKNLQNARALFESHLQSAFIHHRKGWVEKTLADLCEITSALVDPREKQFLDLPHIGGANIKSTTGELFDLKTAREEALISGKFVFDEATVLYSKIRPYLMKVARPDFRGLCSADIYPLTPKSGQVDRNFLFHLLLSPDFTTYANIGSARAGMPKVNREHLFAYRACIPPVSKQSELAIQLDSLAAETQRLTQLYKQKLAALVALKKSLLHQAFTGEL
jgi:type I restriction enzyme, S subunit